MLGVNNGETATIKDIDPETGKLNLDVDGKELSFDVNEYRYIDHGYAVTTHKAQGQTAKNVIAYMDSRMQNFNSFYVSVTRATDSLRIFTDNIEDLKNFIDIQQEKLNAMEIKENLSSSEAVNEIEEYLQNGDSYQAAKTIDDNREILSEDDLNRFEEKLEMEDKNELDDKNEFEQEIEDEINPEKEIEREEGADTELDDENELDKDFLEDDLEKYVDELDGEEIEDDDENEMDGDENEMDGDSEEAEEEAEEAEEEAEEAAIEDEMIFL